MSGPEATSHESNTDLSLAYDQGHDPVANGKTTPKAISRPTPSINCRLLKMPALRTATESVGTSAGANPIRAWRPAGQKTLEPGFLAGFLLTLH